MLLDEFVYLSTGGSNKKMLMEKGYKIEGKTVKVEIEDVPKQSNIKVRIRCDYCNKIIEKQYSSYIKRKENCCIKKDSCNSCSGKKRNEMYRVYVKNELFPEIENAFKERGYKLLSSHEDYKDNESKLYYKCLKHEDKGILSISWGNFKSGRGCTYCGRERTNKAIRKRKLDFNFVREQFENRGYILLEDKYINNYTNMRFICPLHPDEIQSIRYNNLKNGKGCRYCGIKKRNENISGENHPAWDGGKTNLLRYLRNNIVDWKLKSLKEYNYKCALTGKNNGELQIHHLYGFSYIFDEVRKNNNIDPHMNIGNLSKDELDKIESDFFKIHDEYGLGVPLLTEIHKLFHIEYGYKRNNPDQFEEFKQRFYNGEFDECLQKEGILL